MRRNARAIILRGICAGMCALILSGHVTPSFGKCTQRDMLRPVPFANRERLIVRLKLRVEYERTEQWAKLYELLHAPTGSKEEYIKQNVEFAQEFDDLMIDFTPTAITSTYPNSGIYLIEGCATRQAKGRLRNVVDIIEARLVNEEWYFTSFDVAHPNKRCKPKKK